MNATLERYVHALVLFALGVALLGHGMAATVFTAGVTPVTVALPLVGSVVAYRSFVDVLPAASPLSADGLLVLLAVLTTGFVTLVVPPVYAGANVLPGMATPPLYWPGFVAGVAGFAALGVYRLLAVRVASERGLASLLGAALVGVGVGGLLLVVPARPVGYITPADALAGLAGAVLAVALVDFASRNGRDGTPASDSRAGASAGSESGNGSSAQ